MKMGQFCLLKKIAVYSVNYTKHINILFGKTKEFLILKQAVHVVIALI
jgi:hypothetical protein